MTTHFTASNTAGFDNEIADINSGADSAANTPYSIALSGGITVGNETLTLQSGSTLEIDGPGFLVISSGDSFTVGGGGLVINAPFTGDVVVSGGQVTIDPVTSSGGIQGGGAFSGGITGDTATDTVTNQGAIVTAELVAVHLTGGTVTNAAGASISGATYGVAFDTAGVLSNGGTISASSLGVSFAGGGTVSNIGAAAVISGADDGVVIEGVGTVVNGGTIASTNSDAVFALTGTVTNGSVQDTTATIQTQSANGVEIDGVGTVINDGRILTADAAGVYLHGGEVDNGLNAGTAVIQGAEFGVVVSGGFGTVKNQGTIQLSGTPSQSGSQIGVVLQTGGTVLNGPPGVAAASTATISGVDYGVSILDASGEVDNAGSIGGAVAVDLEAGGIVINGAAPGVGTITGTLFGVRVIGMGTNAAVTNDGSISGQVGVDFFDANGSADGTLTDSGAIVSTDGAAGTAVRFGVGSERLVLQSGYAITGIVQGGSNAGDVTTLELGAGTVGAFNSVSGGNGAITGKFTFQSVAALDIDQGANWSFGGTQSVASLEVGGSAQVGGMLTVASLHDDAGGLQLSANATLDLGAAVGSHNTITLTTGSTLKIDTVGQFGTGQGGAYAGDVIAGFVQGTFIDLADLSFASASLQSYNSATQVAQFTDGTHTADLTFDAATPGLPAAFSLHDDGHGGTLVETVACYCAGTLIATPGGEAPVESLSIGDFVLTADGRAEPVRWIGRRCYAGRFLYGRRHLLPIRFAAGSLGDGLPRRDLLVSPAHAMLLDGVLVPADVLVNGAGICQVAGLERVDYFHIELDRHEAILAEGSASETFVDDDSRGTFHNAAEHAALYPGEWSREPVWCAPRLTHGHAVERLRERLSGREAA